MIQTTIRNLDAYACMNVRFTKAFAALKELSAHDFQKGRHDVDGDNIYINALEYDTKPAENSFFEAHREYIDVMLMLDGEETIGVCNVGMLKTVTEAYGTNGDALLAKLEPVRSELAMRPGDVAILFPEDAHAPGMEFSGTSHVRKLIAKVRICA